VQLFQEFQCPDDRLRRQTNDTLSVTGAIEYDLEILTHGSELAGPDVEGIVRASQIESRT